MMAIMLYAGLLGLMMVALSLHVVRGRYRHGSALGDGEFQLLRRVRAQGNFAEYTPLFLVLLGLAEYQGMGVWAVHVLGGWYVTGRLAHAYSLLVHERYEGERLLHWPIWRTCGMVSTFAVIGIISIALLIHYVSKSV
ncbi:MAG: MAPEG family protein [Rickettsiales bacterium]